MAAALIHTLRSRSFAVCVQAALWLLLVLIIGNVGGKAPDLRETDSFAMPAQNLAPIARLVPLFTPAQWPNSPPSTDGSSPFFTRYFVPVPSPVPPPPTTRKIEVTYQGYYQAGDGPRNAIVKVVDTFMVVPVGAAVATNFFVSDASLQSLTLTNASAPPTILLLNAKKEIEVPIK